MVALSLIPDFPNAVAPTSGNNYSIQNVEYTHYMDNSRFSAADGNPILGYSPKTPSSDNQLVRFDIPDFGLGPPHTLENILTAPQWTYLTYPSSNGEVIFTLQSVSTVKKEPDFGGRGGYVRADPATNTLVQGGSPMAWKLIDIAPNVYKMVPSFLPGNDTMVVADANSASQQLVLQNGTNDSSQLWTFNLVN